MDVIKRINEASFDYNNGDSDLEKAQRYAFQTGATWMRREFLDTLWHNADEKPADDKLILYITEYWTGSITALYLLNMNWNEACVALNIDKWLYVDDIIPQGGGYND